MSRLFVAVWLPEEVADDLRALHRKDQRGVRFVPPHNWHITLRFLGEADPDDVIAAFEDLRLPRSRAVVGPAVDVLSERALVLPVAGLDDLAATVNDRTRRLGTDPPRKHFAGHVTIARVKRDAPMPRALGALISSWFDVADVALVQSRLEPSGARYETLATWPVGS